MSDDESQTMAVTGLEYPCTTEISKQELANTTNLGRHVMKLYKGVKLTKKRLKRHTKITARVFPNSSTAQSVGT